MTETPPPKPSIWQIIFSTIAAAFGVQSRRNQERDFQQGNIYTYIISGIVFTVIFVLIVVWVVKIVLSSNGL